MTCVIGLVNRQKVYIGADSAGSDGQIVIVRRDAKVFRVEACPDYMIGFTSSFRMGQLLRYTLKPPKFEDVYMEKPLSLESFMVSRFIPAVKDCLKEGGYATKNYEAEYGGCFLVGYQGHLFRIDADYQVGESVDSYLAIGCGDEVAAGALYASAHLAPVQRILKALQASAHHCNSIRAPFHVLGSDGKEY